MNARSIRFTAAYLALILLTTTTWAQTTVFNYQGRLTDMGNPASGNYQFQFKLFDAATGGTQVGSTIPDVSLTVTQGAFSTQLDFGVSAFPGADRFLEISVRRNAGESYVLLSPRQQIASSPYSIRTVSAQQADIALDSQKLGGVLANQFVQTTDSRLSDARNPLPGSTSYIQNTTTQQTSTNFNIAGNGFIGGNVGIGTTTPVSKLDVRGNLTLEAAGNPGLFTSALSGEQNRYLSLANSPATPTASGLKAGGILVSDDYFFANPTKNDLIVKGNVGIGTNVLFSKLSISGLGYGFAHTSGNVTVGSYIDSSLTGGWFGTKSPHPLLFFTSNSETPQMTLATSGNVGIGTTTPLTRLALGGGPTWTSAGWKASMSLDNGSAMGWRANSTGSRAGIGQTDGGLYFFHTFADFGTNSSSAHYDMVIGPGGNVGIGTTTPTAAKLVVDNDSGESILINGHAKQERSRGGWAKAMIRVNAAGTITYCYNGVTNTIPNCGFFVSHFATGGYNIDFGFQVNDRFGVLTVENYEGSMIYGASPYDNFIQVLTVNLNNTAVDGAFTLVVY